MMFLHRFVNPCVGAAAGVGGVRVACAASYVRVMQHRRPFTASALLSAAATKKAKAVTATLSADAEVVKRPRGRPKAVAAAVEAVPVAVEAKKPRGRPRKSPAPEQTLTPTPIAATPAPAPTAAPTPASAAAAAPASTAVWASESESSRLERARELRRATRTAHSQMARQKKELRRAGDRTGRDIESPAAAGVVADPASTRERIETAHRRAALLRQVEASAPNIAVASSTTAAVASDDGLDAPAPRTRAFGIGEIVRALSGMSVRDLAVYDVASHVSYTDFVVVCTALNERQLEASAHALVKLAKAAGLTRGGYNNRSRISVEAGSQWTMCEIADVWVHFMLSAQRTSAGLDRKYAPYRVPASGFAGLKDHTPTALHPLVVRADTAVRTERQREMDERADAEADAIAARAAQHKQSLEMAEALKVARAEEAAASAAQRTNSIFSKPTPAQLAAATSSVPFGGTDRRPLPTATGPFAVPAAPVVTRQKRVAYGTAVRGTGADAQKIGRGGVRGKGPTAGDRAEQQLLKSRREWVDADTA